MSRVLVVEDEAHLAQGLRFNLEAEGYSAEVVGDGEAATDRLLSKKENFDAIVLDIMLPGKDGFSVVSELRAAQNYVPVLMLTARSSPEDVLKGFAAGADDYLPKPFDLSILLARLQGLLRRSQWMRTGHAVGKTAAAQTDSDSQSFGDFGTFSFDGRTIDFGTLELRTSDNVIHLTLMESSGAQRRASGFPQGNSGRGLGSARRHRHARYRQLYGAAAALHRRRSGTAAPLTYGARGGIPVHSESGKEVRTLQSHARLQNKEPFRSGSLGGRASATRSTNHLLFVVNGSALDLLTRRVSSADRNCAGLAVRGDHGLAGHRNFAAFLDRQVVMMVIDLLDRAHV
jgi:DNA-binding response OmpR family regulator